MLESYRFLVVFNISLQLCMYGRGLYSISSIFSICDEMLERNV